MEKLCKEVEELKLKVEFLTEECREKTTISENLKRVNSEQVAKLKEAKEENEKRSREIGAKDEEISEAKQIYEDLKVKFAEKESALKHLIRVHDNLKSNHVEKVKKLEVENAKLISALDEAAFKSEEQDNMICSYKQEIDKLKNLLSTTKKKCVDAEQSAKAPKEVKRRDSMIARLERDNTEIEEQLKWRTEQFKHLEEAHEKIQEKFQASRKEWDKERANMLDEISSLQTNLDSQTRVVEDLQSKLQMCNQALAHEESRRKMLEVQMSESKALYENVMSEYEDDRYNINSLGGRRDEEIAELRNSLATKSTLAKELEFRITHLEQENEELRSALKELQEAQTNDSSTASSLKTLQQKFRALEQTHRSCSEKFKTRYAEWSFERERLNAELDETLIKVSSKDKELQSVHAELEAVFSSLMHQKLENEELWVALLLLQAKFSEICLTVEEFKLDSEHHIRKAEERICLLTQQVEVKRKDCMQARDELKREHERADSLLSKIEHMDSLEKNFKLMQKDITLYKQIVEESSKKLEQLKSQAFDKENELLNEIKRNIVALDQANSNLSEKTECLSKLEFELDQSKLGCERLEKIKCDLEAELKHYGDERVLMKKDLEDALLAKAEAEKNLMDRDEAFVQTIKEKEEKIKYLHQRIALIEEDKHRLDVSCQAKLDYEKLIGMKTKKVNKFVEDIDEKLRLSQVEVESFVLNYVLNVIDLVYEFEEEKLMFEQVQEKMQEVIFDMDRRNKLHEQELLAATIKQKEAQIEIHALNNALEKTLETHVLEKFDNRYQQIINAELEEEINRLTLKAEKNEMLSAEIFDMDWRSKLHEQELLAATIKQKEAQLEIHALNNALEKTLETHVLEKFDNCYQQIINAELEEEINRLTLKAEKNEMLSAEILTILEEEKLVLDRKSLSNAQDSSKYEEIAASIKDAQMELYPLCEALDNILAGYVLDKQEIYYKDILLAELDEEFDYLERKVEEDQIRMSSSERERMMFQQVIEEKENVIGNTRQKMLFYEHEIASAFILYQQELYYKSILVTELEDEIQHLQLKIKSEEDLSHGLKNSVSELEVKSANVLLEKEDEHRTLLSQISSLEARANMLRSEKQSVCELMKKLYSDNEDAKDSLRSFGTMVEDIHDRSEDVMKRWNRVMQITVDDEVASTNIEADELHGSKKIYSKVLESSSRRRRSPLKEHNC